MPDFFAGEYIGNPSSPTYLLDALFEHETNVRRTKGPGAALSQRKGEQGEARFLTRHILPPKWLSRLRRHKYEPQSSA